MEYLVVKLGGSLLSPNKQIIDEKVVSDYVKNIRAVLTKEVKGLRMILVVGGGHASRVYRDTALRCGEDSEVDQHRIGITATWINAELFRSLLDDLAFKRVLGVGVYAENRKEGEDRVAEDFQKWLSSDKPLLVSGGFVNGASTDFNTVLLASKIGVDRVYKLTNVDYVYSGDPSKGKHFEEIKDISWDEYLRLFSDSLDINEHKPSAHVPVDFLAVQLAKENGISCFLTSGKDPSVFLDIAKEKKIEGTFLHN